MKRKFGEKLSNYVKENDTYELGQTNQKINEKDAENVIKIQNAELEKLNTILKSYELNNNFLDELKSNVEDINNVEYSDNNSKFKNLNKEIQGKNEDKDNISI